MGDNKRSGQEKERTSNITEMKERGLDRPAVGVLLPERYGGDRPRRLSAEDDRGWGSGNEDEPQGDKGESGTGAGAKEPVMPGA